VRKSYSVPERNKRRDKWQGEMQGVVVGGLVVDRESVMVQVGEWVIGTLQDSQNPRESNGNKC